MAFSDWYEIVDRQSQSGQNIINVYHVQKRDPAFTADDMLIAFRDTCMTQIRSIQGTTLDHDVLDCRSLDNPLDFGTLTFSPNAGLLAGTLLSSFTVATIQFNRLRTDMKNGQKRWAAGTETAVAGNFWETSFQTLLGAVGVVLTSAWEKASAPGVPVCDFGILQRICTVDPPPTPCPSYRLPKDDDELVFYIPTTFIARDTVRSQVSRKRLV